MKYQEHFKFASPSERNLGHQEMTMEDMDNYVSPKKGKKLRTTQLQKLFENSSQTPEEKQKGMSQKQKIYSHILQLSSFTYALVSFASVSHMFAIFSTYPACKQAYILIFLVTFDSSNIKLRRTHMVIPLSYSIILLFYNHIGQYQHYI